MVGLEGGVAAVCFRLLKKLRPGMSRAAVYALGFVFVTVFAVMPARDFGQRDHILALLCLPYLLAAALDAEGRPIVGWKAVCVGLAAGVGIALTPHEALIPVAVESMLLVLRRRRKGGSLVRPELVAIMACGVGYVAAVHYFAADYFTRLVPLLRDTYWAFGHLGWSGLVGEAVQLHILAAVTLVAWFVVGRRRAAALGTLLIAAGVASTIAYYVQGTGWYYQQLPALSFFTFALTFLAIDAAEMVRLTTPAWMPKAAAALCLLAVGLTAHFSGYPFTAARSFPIDTPDATFFAGLAPGAPVTTLTTTVDYTVPPVFKYGLTLAQRYPHLWMLPAILRSEDPQGEPLRRVLPPARVAELDALQHAAMREDFARWQPQLVLVERCQDPTVHCQVLEDRHDDLLAWFLRDPGFRDIFAHYHYARSAGSFDAYVPN